MTDVPPGILNTRLEEIALAPAVEFDPAAARALDGADDVSGLWIVVQVLSNNRVRLHRAARDGDAEITAHESMLRPVSRERLLEAFRKAASVEPDRDEAAAAFVPDDIVANWCPHHRTDGNIRCLGERGHAGLHFNQGVTPIQWSDQEGSIVESCVKCGKAMVDNGQCHSGLCHDCSGCADVHAGHEHTADPDFTVEGCADCEALVAESKRVYAAAREQKRKREVDRLLTIAGRISDARASLKRPYTAPTTECDPMILAAVIIADAIGDLTKAIHRLEDTLGER